MTFFIKQNSTLPILSYPISDEIMEKYNISEEMLENVAITFSMKNMDSGIYRIANLSGDLKINNQPPYKNKYELQFRFKEYHTRIVGNYYGEFKIDFLGDDGCGKLTLPSDSTYINIIISNSQTKTTVL